MPLTPETLTRHELNGLRVAVVEADDPGLVGVAGRVVGETMRTLRIESDASDGRADAGREGTRVRQVPKRGTTFEFGIQCTDEAAGFDRGDTDLDDAPRPGSGREAPGTASQRARETTGDRSGDRTDAGGSGACEGAAYVTVDGTRLLSRPALRTEDAGDSKWR